MRGMQAPTQEMIDDQLDRIRLQLQDKFKDRATSTEVAAAVTEETAHFDGAKVTQYIPVLVQHAVQERFRHRHPTSYVAA
jgi:hypothetical protein